MKQKTIIPSVNYHLWQPCNMRCGFCFAKFQDVKSSILPKGHLPKDKALETINLLANYGFKKMTFVGGEPTLCPWISELIRYAKSLGMTTMIVTNGTNLTKEFLKENESFLDWVSISVDSLKENTNYNIGRIFKKKGVALEFYQNLFELINKYDYRLKINTVVNSYNYKEDMTNFIKNVNPERWKVFKVLPIKNQNHLNYKKFEISQFEFNRFLDKHKKIDSLVKEDNDDMIGSYVMIDPAGRFFDNTKGYYTYSSSIIEKGVEFSLNEINTDYDKFVNRKGIYE